MNLRKFFGKSISIKNVCMLCTLSTIALFILILDIMAWNDMKTTTTQISEVVDYYEVVINKNDIKVDESVQTQIDTLISHSVAKADGTLYFDYIFAVLWVVVVVCIVRLSKTSITKPIINICSQLEEIVNNIKNNNGDLTQRVRTKNIDEIGKMANGINLFIEELQSIINTIKDKSELIQDSATMMDEKVSDSNRIALNVSAVSEELSASIEETTATLDQISEGSSSVVKNVMNMSDDSMENAENMSDIKNKANKLMSDTELSKQNAMDTISNIINIVNVAIKESESVEKINELTEEILKISSQTNLLALNASIEASHAGDAGRGFAVVANEIRNLAEVSRDTANNIQEINNIVVQAVNKLSESASQMIRMVNDNVMNDYDKFVDIIRQYKDDADYTYTVLQSFSDKAMSIKETMIAMNNGINDISTAMNDSAQGVTSVAEDISELASAISLIKDKSDDNKEISDELLVEISRFQKV